MDRTSTLAALARQPAQVAGPLLAELATIPVYLGQWAPHGHLDPSCVTDIVSLSRTVAFTDDSLDSSSMCTCQPQGADRDKLSALALATATLSYARGLQANISSGSVRGLHEVGPRLSFLHTSVWGRGSSEQALATQRLLATLPPAVSSLVHSEVEKARAAAREALPRSAQFRGGGALVWAAWNAPGRAPETLAELVLPRAHLAFYGSAVGTANVVAVHEPARENLLPGSLLLEAVSPEHDGEFWDLVARLAGPGASAERVADVFAAAPALTA